MPAILEADDWDAWLGEGAELALLRSLLRPAAPSVLEVFPVSQAVNSVRNNDPTMLDRLPDAAGAASLS